MAIPSLFSYHFMVEFPGLYNMHHKKKNVRDGPSAKKAISENGRTGTSEIRRKFAQPDPGINSKLVGGFNPSEKY